MGALLMAALLFPAVPSRLAPLFWAVGGLGIGLSFTTLSLVVLETAPPGQEGMASSAMQLANQLGAGLGAGIGGAFVTLLGNGGDTLARALLVQFLCMAGVLVAATLAASRLPSRYASGPH
jgi:predicted MFS family arabinose efflux permease